MTNYAKLLDAVKEAENSRRASDAQILVVWNNVRTQLLTYKKSEDTTKNRFIADVLDASMVSRSTFDKRISMLNSAIKKGLKVEKYTSFNSLEIAKGNVAAGTHKATKAGTIISDKVGLEKIQGQKEVIQATNENEIVQILSSELFRKFKAEFAENGYKLANVMSALKKA